MNQAARTTLSLEGDCLVVQVPLRIKRRRGRKEIIAPGRSGAGGPASSGSNVSLAMTIARAHRWREALETGRCASIRALARELEVDSSYVARILRLTLLAPDIVESIIDGTEPDSLSLGQLYQLPMGWEEQRKALT
jgi:hypothetical protein